MPQALRPHSSWGNGGAGGMVSSAIQPAALWPPPRTAIGMARARANRTQAMTSAASLTRTMACGCLSIMAL